MRRANRTHFFLIAISLPILLLLAGGCVRTGVIGRNEPTGVSNPDGVPAADAEDSADAPETTVDEETAPPVAETAPPVAETAPPAADTAEKPPSTTQKVPEDEMAARETAAKEARAEDAREVYRKGMMRKQAGDLEGAAEYFREALKLNPDYIEANEQLTRVRIEMGELPRERADVLREKSRQLAAEKEAMRRDVNDRINRAVALYSENNFKECIRLLEGALDIIEWQPYNIDFGIRKTQAEEILKEARRQQKALEQAEAEAERLKAQRTIEEQIHRQAGHRLAIAREILEQARKQMSRQNFAEARNLCRKVIDDPHNEEAVRAEARALETRINAEWGEVEREETALVTSIEWRDTFIKIREAALPPSGIMNFPPKEAWKQMTKRRERRIEEIQKVFERSQEEIDIQRLLDTVTVPSLTFPDELDLATAINNIMLAFNEVVPIVVSPTVMDKVKEDDKKVFIDIRKELTLKEALGWLTDSLGPEYSYTIRDEAVIITIQDEEEERQLQIYPVQDLLRRLQDFKPPDIDISAEDLFEDTDSSEFEEVDVFGEGNRDTDGRKDFDDPIATEDSLMELITSYIEVNQWSIANQEPEANSIDFKRGDMYIYASENVHKKIQALLMQLRETEDVLVTITARFIEVSQNVAEEIGVDFRGNPTTWDVLNQGLAGMNYTDKFLEGFMTDLTTISGIAPGGAASAERLPYVGGESTGVLATSGVFWTNRSDGWGLVEDADGNAQLQYFTSGIPTGDAFGLRTENILDATLASAITDFAGDGLQAGFELNAGLININFIIDAVEKYSSTSILSAPKITTFNRQRAHIAIVNEQSIMAGVSVSNTTNTELATVEPNMKLFRTGIVLDVRPTVTWDRKYTIIEVKTVFTRGDTGTSRSLDLTPPAKLVSAGLAVYIVQPTILIDLVMPLIHSRNVKTTVMVPDGGTVLLGGLSLLSEATGESGIPVLSKIPILGFFFRRKGEMTEQSVLLIILQADITVAPEAEKKAMEN
ncbi:MAG: tetratricopeptide repeat protein [Planctomycetota bacterium]